MDKKNGFTLIELMIAIAMAGFILGTLGQIIWYGIENYNVNLQLSEMQRKITPVLARIEADLTESKIDEDGGPPTRPTLMAFDANSITVKNRDGDIHEYSWISEDSIKREEDILLRHSSSASDGFVSIEKFKFEAYKKSTEGAMVITTTTPAAFVRIIVGLKGTGNNAPSLNFSTGIKLPD